MTIGEAYRSVLEPPARYDDDLSPVGVCEVLESMFRTVVTGIIHPPEGLRWPYIDGIAGFARPEFTIWLWSPFLGRLATTSANLQLERDLAAIGLVLAYAIRDLLGVGHRWLSTRDDWVARGKGTKRRRSGPVPRPRRGLYDAAEVDRQDGTLAGTDLRQYLLRYLQGSSSSGDVRALIRQALDGLPILATTAFGRRCSHAMRRVFKDDVHADGQEVDDEETVRVAARSNEFDLTADGKCFLLSGNALGWHRGGPGKKEWRRVTRAGPEGRLLASLLLPGGVPASVRPEVVSHLRTALSESAVILEGHGTEIHLSPYGVLSPFAKSILRGPA